MVKQNPIYQPKDTDLKKNPIYQPKGTDLTTLQLHVNITSFLTYSLILPWFNHNIQQQKYFTVFYYILSTN